MSSAESSQSAVTFVDLHLHRVATTDPEPAGSSPSRHSRRRRCRLGGRAGGRPCGRSIPLPWLPRDEPRRGHKQVGVLRLL